MAPNYVLELGYLIAIMKLKNMSVAKGHQVLGRDWTFKVGPPFFNSIQSKFRNFFESNEIRLSLPRF